MIGIIDYGAGNLRSLINAFKLFGRDVKVLVKPEVKDLSLLVLPGVGAFGGAIERLRAFGWIEEIDRWIKNGKPLMGICLGLQLMFEYSEEGGSFGGLGIFKGSVKRFPESGLPIPHMGWNEVKLIREIDILKGFPFPKSFYFAHSYYPLPKSEEIVVGETVYGISFPSIVGKDNILGFQFHPEKSGEWGLELLHMLLERVEKAC